MREELGTVGDVLRPSEVQRTSAMILNVLNEVKR